jgi:cytidine deaminase
MELAEALSSANQFSEPSSFPVSGTIALCQSRHVVVCSMGRYNHGSTVCAEPISLS